MSGVAASTTDSGWHAHLALEYARDSARTVLARRAHHGPLHVQKSFYPEADGTCHTYILHPPGGVVGGDALHIDVTAHADARVLITTPAASKFYRSGARLATQQTRLSIERDAVLEWLPQETLVFDDAWAHSTTRVDVAHGARFVGWETVCLGRPVGDAWFKRGTWRQGFEVWRGEQPLFMDRSQFGGGARVLCERWGLAQFSVSALLVCVANDTPHDLIASLRDDVTALQHDGIFATTQLRDVLVCRYLGHHAQVARACLQRAWEIMRPWYLGKASHAPRIWNT